MEMQINKLTPDQIFLNHNPQGTVRDITNKTTNKINELVALMIADGVMVNRGWIKYEDAYLSDVIIAVYEKDYFADSFEKFYIKANQLEIQASKENFHLTIRFINDDNIINEDMLNKDGYTSKFHIQFPHNKIVH
jgi:hypothetical protein